MENSEDFKSIKVLLDYYNENGVKSEKLMSIKVNTPKFKDKSYSIIYENPKVYVLSFSLKIPEHIHAFIIGKSVPVSTYQNQSGLRDFPVDFAKTITAATIEAVTNSYHEIIDSFRWLKKIESAELKKVIFYEFETFNREFNSDRDGLKFGLRSGLKFRFATGYISNVGGKEQRYNSNKASISETHNRDFYSGLKFINWTEERQQFFDATQKSFEAMSEKINAFEGNLSEDRIDSFIDSNTKLLS